MNDRLTAISNLYNWGKIDKNGLKKAVFDNTITPEQYKEITGEEYFE